jgi:uncharacterized protein (TIGR03546 family)
MLFLNTAKSILSILQGSDRPWQVALGVALGMVMGFSPFNGPQNALIFLAIMLLNVNLGAATLATALFAAIAALLDPLAHAIGYALLVQAKSLTPLWTSLYNLPVVPFTRFNNTVVLGSLVLALVLFVPVLLGTPPLLAYYRAHWKPKVDKWKIMKIFQLTKVVDILEKR